MPRFHFLVSFPVGFCVVLLVIHLDSGILYPWKLELKGSMADQQTDVTPRCNPKQRRDYLLEKCNLTTTKHGPGHRILVDDVHKIILCPLSKVGSTSTRNFYSKLFNPQADTRKNWDQEEYLAHFTRLIDLPQEDQERVIREYFKFFIVRHPLDRLRSSWENKVETHSQLINGSLTPVVDAFLEKSGKLTGNKQDYQLSFNDFITLLTQEGISGFKNEHWNIYVDQCLPCYVKYDHIFHMETLEYDVDPLYKHIRSIRGNIHLEPFVNVNNRRNGSAIEKMTKIASAYQDIDTDTLKKIYDIYRDDFELFGYHWDPVNGTSCYITSENNLKCC